MSSFEQQFDELPEDLQKMVCSKVVYTQPKELLDEIKEHNVCNNIIRCGIFLTFLNYSVNFVIIL